MSENMILGFLVFYPFMGALMGCLIGRNNERARDYFADFIGITEFAVAAVLFIRLLAGGEIKVLHLYLADICGFGLHFELDGFRTVYACIAALMWMMTMILSREYCKHHADINRFYLFMLATLGATMGVFLSEDLFTTFIFFEIMSFTSYVWVAQEETADALKAAGTYLAVAVIGGLVMLMGIFLLYKELGTLNMDELYAAASAYDNNALLYAAGACMLFGFGAKAGAFPMHIWLPKAHPVAPAPASALLSGILTKTGIFGIIAISANIFRQDERWGILILCLGVLTMFGGAMLAVFSVDLKRTLACSSMSQIGFIMIGIGCMEILGEDNGLAAHGTMLHMVNHSLIKLVLFMAAGVIYMNTHALNLNEIRGYGRKKPLLKIIFLVGALAIGGIPAFSGYISKTLLHEGILECGMGSFTKMVEVIFLFSGGLTVAYMTKLFVAIFVEKNEDEERQKLFDGQTVYMNKESTFALLGSAIVLLVWGLFPHALMDRVAELGNTFFASLSETEAVQYFNFENLKGAVISITVGAIVYWFFIRKLLMKDTHDGRRAYIDAWPKYLDLEHVLYRPVLLTFLPALFGFLFRVLDSFADIMVVLLRKTIYKDTKIPYEYFEGNGFTVFVGNIMNRLQKFRKRIGNKNEDKDYIHLAAVAYERTDTNLRIVQRSQSFGFFLFGIGLLIVMIYILL